MDKLNGGKVEKMPWEKKQDKGYTELSRTGFYSSSKWIKIRDFVIKREPLCRMCLKAKGYRKPANMVDHIESINMDSSNELKYGIENLQALCFTCHRIKTRKDGSKNSEANLKRGLDLMRDLES